MEKHCIQQIMQAVHADASGVYEVQHGSLTVEKCVHKYMYIVTISQIVLHTPCIQNAQAAAAQGGELRRQLVKVVKSGSTC